MRYKKKYNDSVVNVVSRLGLDDLGFKSQQGQEVFCFQKRLDRLWDPPSLLFNGYWGSFLGVKRWGPKVDHSPPSSDDVKNERNYTFNPLYAFMTCKKQVKFTIYSLKTQFF